MKKKGIIVVIALLLVAAVLAVVFVMLFKDKDTKSLAQDLNAAVTQEYLAQDSKEYTTIQNYLDRAQTAIGVNSGFEATNYRQAYEAYTTIAKFFNKEAAFMEHTKTYSRNRKKIVSALNSAQSNANKMVKAIEDSSKLVGGNDTWERVVWNNYKEYVQDMVSDTMKAFELLSTVYASSVASELRNNDLTDLLFLAIKELNSNFKKNATTKENLGNELLKFSQACFKPGNVETAVLNYYYTQDTHKNRIKAAIKDIQEKGLESLYWTEIMNGTVLY